MDPPVGHRTATAPDEPNDTLPQPPAARRKLIGGRGRRTSPRGAGGRWRRLGLLGRFSLLSALPMALLGLTLGHALRGFVQERALEHARQSASVMAQLAVRPLLTPADIEDGLTPQHRAALDRSLKDGPLRSEVARIKIWNRAARVVYSDDPQLIGRTFLRSEELKAALAGNVASEFSDLEEEENASDRGFGQLLEVYVPLSFGETVAPAGAFELCLPYGPIAAGIAHDTKLMYLVLLAGLILLWLLLFPLVAGASRRLQHQARQSVYEALHDTLTSLPNRNLFRDRAEHAIALGRRTGTSVAVVLLDLDRFKEVNETLGHHAGDELLCEAARRLVATVRESDTVARLGGDEFGFVLPNASSPSVACLIAERVLAAMAEPFTLEGLSVEVPASLGIAMFPDHGEGADVLLQRAEVAMYQAKGEHTGYQVYDPKRDAYSPARLSLLGELRQAIPAGQLELHYQPEVEIRTRRVIGVEALVRWNHPIQGMLYPDAFIPMAEHTDLIRPLTLWVLEEALRQRDAWRRSGLDLVVAVNLSARNLHHPDLPDDVARLLLRSDTPGSRLELEITESSVMTDPACVLDVLERLSGLGVNLAIDDFGTGYSSLSYLKRLPVDDLKIDRSFIMNVEADENDAAIVRTTIDLGRNLGMRVVAEGVETEAAWMRLATLGCDVVQGEFLSAPMPADQVAGWVEARSRTQLQGATHLIGGGGALAARA